MKSIKVSIADRPPNIELLIARLCELFLENKKVTAPTMNLNNLRPRGILTIVAAIYFLAEIVISIVGMVL